MPRALVRLEFFLDNNVPDSIGRYLQGRGHGVKRQRFHIPADSPDQIVATTAMEAGCVLVTLDRDFNNQRFQKDRFARLNRISLSGAPHLLLGALKSEIQQIEFRASTRRANQRLIVHLAPGQIRFRD